MKTISLWCARHDYNDYGQNRKLLTRRTWGNAFGRRTENLVSGNDRAVAGRVARGNVDGELDGALQRIRAGRNIQTPIITCSKCGITRPAAEPHVSVRALILALARFEIASKDQTRALEKEWAAYRKHIN